MKKKLQFRPAAPDELQIDLDRPRARIPKRLLRLVSEHVAIRKAVYSSSRSGNTHVTIFIKPGQQRRCKLCETGKGVAHIHMQAALPIMERILLQAALGSDPVRELLSWGRARNGCPYPTLFFEEKKK